MTITQASVARRQVIANVREKARVARTYLTPIRGTQRERFPHTTEIVDLLINSITE